MSSELKEVIKDLEDLLEHCNNTEVFPDLHIVMCEDLQVLIDKYKEF